MNEKQEFESIDSVQLANISGGLSNAAMTKMVLSRASSQTRGEITPVGRMSFGPDKSGFVMGHGKFDSKLWGTTDHRAMNFVVDVNQHKVEHLQTHSIGFVGPAR